MIIRASLAFRLMVTIGICFSTATTCETLQVTNRIGVIHLFAGGAFFDLVLEAASGRGAPVGILKGVASIDTSAALGRLIEWPHTVSLAGGGL